MKNQRQAKILEIISKHDVDTQEALIGYLAAEGFPSTQTTVSRDLRDLRLIKIQTESGSYKYAVPSDIKEEGGTGAVVRDAVTLVRAAGNITVVKTHAGLANAVAVTVERKKYGEIIGSVAGDDTILFVTEDEATARALAEKITGNFM